MEEVRIAGTNRMSALYKGLSPLRQAIQRSSTDKLFKSYRTLP